MDVDNHLESFPAGAPPPAEPSAESLDAEGKAAANGVLSRRAVAVAVATAAAAAEAATPDAEDGEETESEEEPSWELTEDLSEYRGDPGDRKAQLLFKQLQTVRHSPALPLLPPPPPFRQTPKFSLIIPYP